MSEAKPKSLGSLNVVNPNDKVEQLRREFASTGAVPPNHSTLIERACDESRTPAQRAVEEKVIAALKTVYDPEIPVDVYELGLIYEICAGEDGVVAIRMTLTAPGCPVAGMIVEEVRRKAGAVEGVKGCKVDLVWDPPWSKERMSEAALLELGLL